MSRTRRRKHGDFAPLSLLLLCMILLQAQEDTKLSITKLCCATAFTIPTERRILASTNRWFAPQSRLFQQRRRSRKSKSKTRPSQITQDDEVQQTVANDASQPPPSDEEEEDIEQLLEQTLAKYREQQQQSSAEAEPLISMTQADCDKLLAHCVAHNKWDAVLEVLDVMKEQGLSQVRTTYSACLEACRDAMNGDSALEILTAMQQAGFVPTRDDYALAVATLCPAPMPTDKRILPPQETDDRNNLDKNNYTPGSSTRNYPKDNWKDALTIVQEQVDLPVESYDRVLRSLTRVRKWKESTRLLRFMEDRTTMAAAAASSGPDDDDVPLSDSTNSDSTTTISSSGSNEAGPTPPALSTYSAVLECCLAANQSEQAVQVLHASLRRGLVPSVFSFEQVIQALSQKLQWRRALQVVHLMDDHDVPMTLNLYNALLTSCARAREVVQAKNLLAQMRQKHGIAPNIRSYNAVLSACASTRRWKDALAVLDQCHLDPYVQPDIYTYTGAIRACAKGGRTRRALTLLQVVKDKGLPLDTYCYTAAIEACAKARMWQKALELLDEMEDRGIAPSEVTYSVTITACGNGGEWQKALDLLSVMRQKKMRINLITYNAAITALSKAAKQTSKDESLDRPELWIMALDILQQMKEDGVSPDGFSFCSAISCCGAEGRWQEALDLMAIMQKGGPNLRPNKIAYTAAIASCGRSGQVTHAMNLFRLMKDQGLSADRVAYNALFSALRVAKRADAAVELWEEMVGAKQSRITKIATAKADTSTTPDIITVTDAIGAITSEGSKENLEKADKVFAEAVRLGIVLRPGTLDSANEIDLSGMSLPVARAACRYILNRVKGGGGNDIESLTFITGVGVAKVSRPFSAAKQSLKKRSQKAPGKSRGSTSLREYVQEILLTDFNLQTSVPRLAQGTVVIGRRALQKWLQN